MLSSGIPRNIFHEWLQFSEYTRTRRVEVKNQLFMSGTFLCERADKPYDIQSGLFLRLKSSISSSVVSFPVYISDVSPDPMLSTCRLRAHTFRREQAVACAHYGGKTVAHWLYFYTLQGARAFSVYFIINVASLTLSYLVHI